MLHPSPIHPVEPYISKMTALWDSEPEYDVDEHYARRQKSMPDMGLASAWNTSHASKHSPQLRSPPSNSSLASSTIQHCPCCTHSAGSRTVSLAATLASPTLPERKAFLHTSTMSRRTAAHPLPPVQVHPYQPLNTVKLSPELKLSSAESEVLWMLPAMQSSPSQSPREESMDMSRRKAKGHGRFRGLISSSKETIKHIWRRGEDPDIWDSPKYR